MINHVIGHMISPMIGHMINHVWLATHKRAWGDFLKKRYFPQNTSFVKNYKIGIRKKKEIHNHKKNENVKNECIRNRVDRDTFE